MSSLVRLTRTYGTSRWELLGCSVPGVAQVKQKCPFPGKAQGLGRGRAPARLNRGKFPPKICHPAVPEGGAFLNAAAVVVRAA